MIRIGLENILKDRLFPTSTTVRFGLLCNQASTDSSYNHSRDCVRKLVGERLTCLLSPQHGFFSEKQDNMIESDHSRDLVSGLPLFSLYGESRKPSREMYDLFDVLLVDLVDVGTRVYTFLYTMAYCLEAAAEYGKKVIILDRPNPVAGDKIEGNLLKDDCASFVGQYPIPMRHGLTFGELARMINKEFSIDADLDVIKMSGWRRTMYFRDTGFPWVFPSPNMPTPETAVVYPGQVIWEGTNISEGRGTTAPFELIGAPFIQHGPILEKIGQHELPGCFFRPVMFQPTSSKWNEKDCFGFFLHVTDRREFMPYRTTLALLQAVMFLYPNEFQYKDPPYEYEYDRLPMDLVLGDSSVRKKLEDGMPLEELENSWAKDLREFGRMREKYFLYD